MVTEGVLDSVFFVISGLLLLLPDLSWNVDSSAFNIFLGFVEMGCYFFPLNTIASIFGIVVSLLIWRAVISLIRTIWEILPFV